MMLVGDNLLQSRKLQEPKQKTYDSEQPNNKIYVSKSWQLPPEQMPKTETEPSLRNNCNVFTLCEIINADHRGTPSKTAGESAFPKQEALLDLTQQRVLDDRLLKHPSATEIVVPTRNGKSKDFLCRSPPKPNIFLNHNATQYASQGETLQQTGKENHYLSSQKESSTSINNLNKVSDSESKAEKPVNAPLQHTCLSNIQSDAVKCLQYPEEELQKFPVSVEATHPVCEVRFIKGILKHQSKYMSEDATCVYGPGHLIFAKQVALAIRDSVELTRARAKDVEGNKSIKKKLRWFDEVHLENTDKEQNVVKGNSSNVSQSKNNSEDHQLSVTTVSGASKPGHILTPAASTGYHFTKQAWADVGVQVSLPQEQAHEVKVPRSIIRTTGPKVPWRERSTRVGVGPVSSQPRKGTVIRTQSATEVSQIAKTQGNLMVPRPPPRMEEKMAHITKTPYGVDHASVNCHQALAVEHNLQKDNCESFFSPYTHHRMRTDSTVMYTPLPPSYTFPVSEGHTRGTPSSAHLESYGFGRRRGIVLNEKGLCLDCTPTDEEISQLWHGVRSALTSKDGNVNFGTLTTV